MYSIDEEIEKAWQELFLLAGKINPELLLPESFLNSVDDKAILSKKTRLSHICGLLLTDQYSKQLKPLCSPHFDMKGFEGPYYFSYFIVPKTSTVNSIDESKGMFAVINNFDSNSGFNVLRHEIEILRKLGSVDKFYKKITISGAHKNSLQCLIDEKADIASIDAASYYYLQRNNPELKNKLKIIGSSIKSPSPPFVTHRKNPLCLSSELILTLNEALLKLNIAHQNTLKIKHFSFVPFSDYEAIAR